MNLITNFYCKTSLILLILCISCNSQLQKSEIVSKGIVSTIGFENEMHDFGKIPAKKEVTTNFSFTNTGVKPLIITEVIVTCGCTVPEYQKEPIQPNAKGEIKIIYDAKSHGRFKKTIAVHYNGKDSPKLLIVKGEVQYPDDSISIN